MEPRAIERADPTPPPPLPSLFLSHGSPMLALEDSPAGRFLDGLGGNLPAPRAIVVASAHFEAPRPTVGGNPGPRTVHDFRGFPPALHAIQYPAPGDIELASLILRQLQDAGMEAAIDPERGLDHGVWVPLRRMYPGAKLPVVPISVNPDAGARHHLLVGRALANLREQGVLVVGSGGFVHSLGDLDWDDRDAAMPEWALAFANWMHGRIGAGDTDALLDWERLAPNARRAHPTTEHLMPLFVALGAAADGAPVRVLHRSHEFGSLALDAFAFG